MKKSTNIFFMLVAIVVMALACGCSDDDDYTPGEQSDPNSMNVFFSDTNPNKVILYIENEYKVNIKLSRLKTDKAATVPIKVLKKDDVFVIPESVDFLAGQSDSEITITFPSADITSYSFILAIEGKEYVDQYAAVEGHSLFDCTVNIEKWDVAISQATFAFATFFEPQKLDILKQDGANRYKIVNYLNSGFDFIFSIDAGKNIVPEGGHSASTTNWYFSTGNTACYPVPKPANEGLYVTNFYIYVSTSGTHSYVDFDKKKGSIYHNNTYNKGAAGWNRFNFSWE